MAVKETQTNIRVEVGIPDSWQTRTVQREFDAARELAATITRRLDADERGRIDINSDLERVCEFCGRPWTEDSILFNGGCCGKDADEEDARQEKGVQEK